MKCLGSDETGNLSVCYLPQVNMKVIYGIMLMIMSVLIISIIQNLNCYMSTLHLVHYALLLTPACWKYSNTDARLMALALSLALDPIFGIHSHKTLDTAQPCHLLTPNWKPSSCHSISTPININTQFLLVTVCLCMCVCVCFHIMPYVNCFGRMQTQLSVSKKKWTQKYTLTSKSNLCDLVCVTIV